MIRFVFPCVVLLVACSPRPQVNDAGAEDASVEDGGPSLDDSGLPDGGALDASVNDAGETDASVSDAGGADAGSADASTPDAAVFDAGAADAAVDDAGCLLRSGVGAPFRLRAVAANLSSGNGQNYDPGNGLRILQGIEPDVVMIQEFGYGDKSPAAMQQFVDLMSFDAGFSYTRGAIGGTGGIPNGIISRWPIDYAGEWVDPQVNNRGFVWAHIDLPGPRDLWAVSVHLLTTSGGARAAEAAALLSELQAHVRPYDFVLVGGDFNSGTQGENCFSALQTRVFELSVYPTDQSGNENTSGNRSKPYDHVLGSGCLLRNQRPTVAGAVTLDGGLIVDTRVYVPLTEIAPAQFGDSNASNMQHMAVVKDFLIQP